MTVPNPDEAGKYRNPREGRLAGVRDMPVWHLFVHGN